MMRCAEKEGEREREGKGERDSEPTLDVLRQKQSKV